jgi:hypothetical protein
MSRGILYLTWRGERGDDAHAVLQRSLASIKHWHPELPHKVVEMPDGSNLLCKSQMYDLSPYDETLFLDADTTAMGKLDYGFLKAQQHGIACCINANPWQRRYYKLPREHDDAIEYSSGVVFFDRRNNRVKEVFKRWKTLSSDSTMDSRSKYISPKGACEMPLNDQALFTLALEQAQFNPFVLPLNWNLYPKWQKHFWGPLKVLHGYDDIPQSVMQWNWEQSQPDAIVQCVQWPDKKGAKK